ncbi:MAG: hypothetical protein ACYSUP_15810 [Planctomycetota bacterium]|jgi:hypothetical protein
MKRLFTEGFTVMDIAEPLFSFDVDRSAPEIKQIIDQDNVEVVGVRDKGTVSGYALRDELTDGTCRDHLHNFDEGSILTSSASYRDVIQALDRSSYCFVQMLGQVIAYVTRTFGTNVALRYDNYSRNAHGQRNRLAIPARNVARGNFPRKIE